jgi:CheY-like chemotaxis protein
VNKVIVFHNDEALRAELVEAFQHAGCDVYNAADTGQAWRTALAIKPNVVIVDYPSYVDDVRHGRSTLTEAIRAEPGLRGVAIVNIATRADTEVQMNAATAGVTLSLPRSVPAAGVVAAASGVVRELARQAY